MLDLRFWIEDLGFCKNKLNKRTKQIGLEVIKLIDQLPNKPSAWAPAKF